MSGLHSPIWLKSEHVTIVRELLEDVIAEAKELHQDEPLKEGTAALEEVVAEFKRAERSYEESQNLRPRDGSG